MNASTDDHNVLVFPATAAGPTPILAPGARLTSSVPLPAPAGPFGSLPSFLREHRLPVALGCMALALTAAFAVLEGKRPSAPPAATPAAQRPAPATAPTMVTPSTVLPAARGTAAPQPTQARQGDLKNEVAPAGVRFVVRRIPLEAAAPAAALRGWEALRTGDMETARDAYAQAQREDGRNLDALRGLVAIAQRQGQSDEALHLNRQILEIDPQDAVAAALLGSPAEGDAVSEESRLKTLAAADESVAATHFALGNHYARQERWAEAEQAYFNAVAAEPQNPDYHYNLAVCLDRLTQPQLASQYYKSALARSATQAPAFDVSLAKNRLAELAAH